MQDRNKYLKKQPSDVYDYLNMIFNELTENVDKLKLNVNQFALAQRKEVLCQILNGEIYNLNNIKEKMQGCGIKLAFTYFIVVVFKLDSFREICVKCSSEDISLIKFSVLNIASELLGWEKIWNIKFFQLYYFKRLLQKL